MEVTWKYMELADWEIVTMLVQLITYLGDRKEYAKQEKVYGRWPVLLGKQGGEEKLLQALLALCWCATERPKVVGKLKQV